jgi:hypothetical protein
MLLGLLAASCVSAASPAAGERAGIESPSPAETVLPDADATEDPFADVYIRFFPDWWLETDFSKHSARYEEFIWAGPDPDGIPAIDTPIFGATVYGDAWLEDESPVLFFEWQEDARAYPLDILMYHEIVNDTVGGLPVAVTYCPLWNSALVFDRSLPDGTLLDFGTTGNLRKSNLVMFDRTTHSWWQQFSGEALIGELTGNVLAILPSQIASWADFKLYRPEGTVLSRQTGEIRPYGNSQYPGYDEIDATPFLFEESIDERLPAMERVVALSSEGVDMAYPFHLLQDEGVINDQVAGTPIVIFWAEGTKSPFGEASDPPGASAVFVRTVDETLLTFAKTDKGFIDGETGSLWNIFGQALEGPMTGTMLQRVPYTEPFWFAWAAFRPETEIWSRAE